MTRLRNILSISDWARFTRAHGAETSKAKLTQPHLAVLLILASLLMPFLVLMPMSAAEAGQDPLVWVGSPVDGVWGRSLDSTPAGEHHKLIKASPRNDWAVDLAGIGTSSRDREVRLYAAASNTKYNKYLDARVSQVKDNACRLGGGGDLVTVQIRYKKHVIGQVTFAHVDKGSHIKVGASVSRWGGYIGRASNLKSSETGGSKCWTGRHVHFEMRSSHGYSCWNRGYAPNYRLRRSNFVGFMGGTLPGSARPCR